MAMMCSPWLCRSILRRARSNSRGSPSPEDVFGGIGATAQSRLPMLGDEPLTEERVIGLRKADRLRSRRSKSNKALGKAIRSGRLLLGLRTIRPIRPREPACSERSYPASARRRRDRLGGPAAGEETSVPGLMARTAVPKGHKLALRDIPAGRPVHKLATPIGQASAQIATGEHVHVHNLRFVASGASRSIPDRGPEWRREGNASPVSFDGYVREDGRVGTAMCFSSLRR